MGPKRKDYLPEHYPDSFFKDIFMPVTKRIRKENAVVDKRLGKPFEPKILEMLQCLSTEKNVSRFVKKFGDESGFLQDGLIVFYAIFALQSEDNSSDESNSDDDSVGPDDSLYTFFEKKGNLNIAKLWMGLTLAYRKPLRIALPLGVHKVDDKLIHDMFSTFEDGHWRNQTLNFYFNPKGFLQSNFNANLSLNLLFVPSSMIGDVDRHIKFLQKKYTFICRGKEIVTVNWRELQYLQEVRLQSVRQDMLQEACKNGNTEIVRQFLALNEEHSVMVSEVNSKDVKCMSRGTLHQASHQGHVAIVKLLIESKFCDINLTDKDLRTALHLASKKGQVKTVKLLIRVCYVNFVDKEKRSALHLATLKNHVRVVELLLGRKDCDVNLFDRSGRTALHLATLKNHLQIVTLLLRTGRCKLHLRDKGNHTALRLALQLGRENIVLELISSTFVYLLTSFTTADFNIFRQKGNEATLYACLEDITIACEKMYYEKVTLFSPPDFLLVALQSPGNVEEVEKYLNELDIKELESKLAKKRLGITPLGLASKNGYGFFVEKVLNDEKCGRFVNEGCPSPLWLASNSGHASIVRRLLSVEIVNIDYKAPDGTTALMMAILKDHHDVVDAFTSFRSRCEIVRQLARFGKSEQLVKTLRDSSDFEIGLSQGDFGSDLITQAFHSGDYETLSLITELTKLEPRAIINDWKNIHSLKILATVGVPTNQNMSVLVRMSKVFPKFNAAIEEKWIHKEMSRVHIIRDISPHILGDFCCIQMHMRNQTNSFESYFDMACEHRDATADSFNSKYPRQNNQLLISKMDKLDRCFQSCVKQEECAIVRDLLKTCQLLEAELNSKSNTLMSMLKPQFILIGSVAEGTKIGQASEMDVSVEFQGLANSPFLTTEKATSLFPPACLKELRFRDSGVFDYNRFLQIFLTEIQEALLAIRSNLPKNIRVDHETKFQPCENCLISKQDSFIYEPSTHCVNCLPQVTFTRLGPCLIFQLLNGRVATIDLVALFPVKVNSVLKLYHKVVSTLVEDRPPNWLNYLNTLIGRDAILPEAFSLQKNNHETIDVAIKLLNYGDQNNYIVRPSQELTVEHFENLPILKKVYVHMKALRDILQINAKSYFMKKVVLLPEFVDKVRRENTPFQVLYDVLSYPDLKRSFRQTIDFVQWKKNIQKSVSKDRKEGAANNVITLL